MVVSDGKWEKAKSLREGCSLYRAMSTFEKFWIQKLDKNMIDSLASAAPS